MAATDLSGQVDFFPARPTEIKFLTLGLSTEFLPGRIGDGDGGGGDGGGGGSERPTSGLIYPRAF